MHSYILLQLPGSAVEGQATQETTFLAHCAELELLSQSREFQGLPRNHFVDKLVEAQKISKSSDEAIVNCDICPKHSGHEGTISVSEMFCVECQQHYV